MDAHLANPIAQVPYVSQVSVLHRFEPRKNSRAASTITEGLHPVIKNRRRLELVHRYNVSIWIRFVKLAAKQLCGLASAISGGAQSARRLLPAACPHELLSLQAA
jgi:hypothetical protein